MIRRFFILTIGILISLAVSAKEEADSAHMKLYHRYYQLFDSDSTEAFYGLSEKLKEHYLNQGRLVEYYKIRQNEIFYDSERGKFYKAIKKANSLLDDMKKSKTKHYELAYMSLGHIFELQGNYRTAVQYYLDALDNIDMADSAGRAHIYSQLAGVNLARNAHDAQIWNERLGRMISHDSLYYKSYLVLKNQICFFAGEKEEFFKSKREFDEYVKRHSSLDGSGEHILAVMENAFLGKYGEALALLGQRSHDYDEVRRCDIRIRIYEMMGRTDLALKETETRRDFRDSLNNNLLFDNLNEINATIGVAKLTEQAAKERDQWLSVVIILLFVALGLMISRYLSHRSYQKKILKQNEELEIALDEAKESDRMKSIFISHISHEIRTPLNIISGYIEIVASPEYELGAEERETLLKGIEQNTIAITDIVNDLLEISLEESKERYRKDDKIVINDFCGRILKETENRNEGRLQLNFQTSLSDDFYIQSNEGGVERILRQLMNNALKFTEQGHVDLSVTELADEGCVRFTVTDTGVGIPEDQHEQVFEHFYKVDSFKQGLGIGLPMSRNIAVLLGGSLTIDKDYHDGTRMVLTLPIK
ncbi:MAG: HAMP domain-containing histidine kinase [Prevotella sp.]|nr:HAMP domain-containing histidine kinase [Prevotella sp.]